VVGELDDWVGHSPDQLQAMRDGLTALNQDGASHIED
jgi:rifampin ADP-ribosylating transferase